jgi:hypothetical protein
VFQATVAHTHPVAYEGLAKVLALLPAKDEYKLYFAVPDYRFDAFTKQTIHVKKGSPVQRPTARVACVRQFALKVVC